LAFGLHTNRLTVNRFPRRNLFKVDCRRIVWKEEFPAFMAGLSHDPGEPQTVALEILHGRQQLGALLSGRGQDLFLGRRVNSASEPNL